MPPDLTAFAKQYDIQLLTHNDPKGETDFLFFFVSESFSFVFVPMGEDVKGLFPEYWPI